MVLMLMLMLMRGMEWSVVQEQLSRMQKADWPWGTPAHFPMVEICKNTIHGMLQEKFSPQTDSHSEFFY